MSSPCGGCPPHCKGCIFSNSPSMLRPDTVVQSKEKYGCIRPDAGALVLAQGILGMMRGTGFHPVTPDGAAFLRSAGNPLAAHC